MIMSRRFKFKEAERVTVSHYGKGEIFQRQIHESKHLRGGYEKLYLIFWDSGKKPVWMLESKMKRVKNKKTVKKRKKR